MNKMLKERNNLREIKSHPTQELGPWTSDFAILCKNSTKGSVIRKGYFSSFNPANSDL